jgi:DNA repair protein RecN (Recombination protein N)
LIIRLKRKYGATITDILQYRDKIKTELDGLQNNEESVTGLEKQINKLSIDLMKLCDDISEKRKQAATKFQKQIEQELDQLGMKKARFKVGFDKYLGHESGKHEFTQTGYDKTEFLFSPNVGEDLKPLKEIASGGEMSRTMLAIKTVLGKADEIPVLVFDEIDSGVSGPMGQVIGQKLAKLSATHQVFSITHLPQIAAFADSHYYIHKEIKTGRTTTVVDVLDTIEDKTTEVARMLSGDKITAITKEHAKELISSAKTYKKS